MRIERLAIDGFGRFFEREFGPFDPTLTVIYGPNEAGKSTLLAFIANVLFGFQQKDDALQVPALAGGRRGGRLAIVDDAGNHYVVERHAGPGRSAGNLFVTTGEGVPADVALERLLGAATPDLFRSVFAFGLDQLQSLSAADNGDISAAIYGAGLGVKNLGQSIALLEKRMGEIFKSGARAELQPMEKTRRDIESLDQRLLAMSKHADRYDALLARREEVLLLGEEIARQSSLLRDEHRRIERVQQGWTDWVRLVALDQQLAALPVFSDFPEDALARLEKAETEAKGAQGEYDDAAARARELRERAVAIPQDDAVLAIGDIVARLREERTSVVNALNSLPGLRATIEQAQAQQASTLRELGAGWDEERALSFDVSIPVRNAVQQHKAALQQDDQAWRTARETEMTRTADLKEADRKLQELTEMAAATPAPADAASLRLRRRVLTTLRDQWNQVVALRQNHQRSVTAAMALRPSAPSSGSAVVVDQWGWARDDIERHRLSLESADRRVTASAATTGSRLTDLTEAEAELDRARRVAEALPQPPLDASTLRERQRLLTQARRQEAELATLRSILRREEDQLAAIRSRPLDGAAGKGSSAIPSWLTYGLALAGVAGIMVGLLLAGDARWPSIAAGVLLLAAAALLYFLRTSNAGSSDVGRNPIGDQEMRVQAAGEQVTAAETSLRQTVGPMVSGPNGPTDLDGIEQEIAAAQATLATWTDAQMVIRRAEDDVARRGRAVDAARHAQAQAEADGNTVRQQWAAWLSERELDPTATVERVLDFVAAWERAEAAAGTVAEAEAKLVELARPLALTGPVDETALNQEDLAIEMGERDLNAWEQRQAAVQRAVDDTASKRRLLEGAADIANQMGAKREATQAAWETWLRTAELDPSYQPDTVLDMMQRLDVVRERHSVLMGQQQAVAGSESMLARYREVLGAALTALNAAPMGETDADLLPAVDQLIARHEAGVAAQNRLALAEGEVERAEQDLERRGLALERARAELAGLLDLGGVEDAEAFRRRAREQAERVEAERARAACLLHLQTLSGPDPAWTAFQEDLRGAEPDTIPGRLQQLTDELAALEERRNALLEERGRIDLETKQLEGDVSASDLRAQRAVLIEQLHSHARQWAALAVAKRLIEQARLTYERDAQPAVIRQARSFFSAITAGQYDNIFVPLEQTGGRRQAEIFAIQADGSRKAPTALSRGTREQLYLSLRFGLIRNLGERQERLPVIVDDALVNFDPDRAQRAAEAFTQLAQTHQVLVFTCHPTTVEHFRLAAPQARILSLEGLDAPPRIATGRAVE